MELTEKEKQRYLRHTLLDEIGVEGQLKLKKASVLVIGAGGLGSPVLQYLAAAGVGTIGIIDNDRVDMSNLQRQILYSEKNIGEPKVIAAANRLREMNASLKIRTYNERLTAANAEELFSCYDIIVEGTDSFTSKYLANDAALLTGKPLVFGSIFKFEGQVSVFNYQDGPTYRCLFPEPASPGEMPSCSEVGVLGVLPGIVGSLQANETLKIILGIGDILSGKLLLFNALNMQTQILPFSKNGEYAKNELQEINYSCETTIHRSITYKEYRDSPDSYTLLDVRTQIERETFGIGGKHIPLAELETRSRELISGDYFLVYCASGIRSLQAISVLKQFYPQKTFINLEGGIRQLK